MIYLGAKWEVSIDFSQWLLGFNYVSLGAPCWNVFLGPVRIGYWDRDKMPYLNRGVQP